MIPREERELLSKEKVFVIPNINEEARIFEWAGISFGEESTYLLSKSIKVCIINKLNYYLNRDLHCWVEPTSWDSGAKYMEHRRTTGLWRDIWIHRKKIRTTSTLRREERESIDGFTGSLITNWMIGSNCQTASQLIYK
jgi:hypothetical protein